MIDLHSHVLDGLDDGAASIEESVAIARSMAEDGVRKVAATPHVRDDYPTTPDAMEAALARVRAAVAAEGIPIEILPGGEVAMDELSKLDADARARFGLGGNPNLLLLEFPYYGWPMALPQLVWDLVTTGTVVVIAHPERNAEVQERPDRLEGVVDMGAAIQLTAASVDGRLGKRTAGCSRALLELGLAHLIASDAHAPGVRLAGMSAAAAAVGGGELAEWLTSAVPAALIAGEELPPRPLAERRRGLLGRLRG